MTLDSVYVGTLTGNPIYVQGTEYDSAGRITLRSLGYNAGASQPYVQTRFTYYAWNIAEDGGKLQRIFSQRPAQGEQGAITHQDLVYDYDENGNIEQILDYASADPQTEEPLTQDFEYDALDRLTYAIGHYGGRGNYDPETYDYNSVTGNLSSKAGVTYTYSQTHKHAVTGLSNNNAYDYDANGNMIERSVVISPTLTEVFSYTYNAENRLIEVSGDAAAEFVYNGDGQRVVATEGITKTVFVGNYFEWQVASDGVVTTTETTKYYYAGGTRVAMQRGGEGTKYLLGDHLGSASVVLNADGTERGAQGYLPWGEVNFTEGTIDTEYTYTGQYNYSDFGLAYYNARWYDSSLGRFAQADTIIPSNQGVQAWDRYAYANNNALKYTDPTGHQICGDDGYCGRDGRNTGSLAESLFENEDWWRFVKIFRLKIDARLSETARLAIYAAVFAVAMAFANALPTIEKPEEFFVKVFGELWFEVADVADWGYAADHNHIQLDPKSINWNSSHIVNFLVHEMGHAFAQSIRNHHTSPGDSMPPYTALATTYHSDPNFPVRPDGFAGDGWEWSNNAGREGHSDEFADMFLGWVLGVWSNDVAGTTRNGWMNENMPTWLSQVR